MATDEQTAPVSGIRFTGNYSECDERRTYPAWSIGNAGTSRGRMLRITRGRFRRMPWIAQGINNEQD